jgi:hypothetical protein
MQRKPSEALPSLRVLSDLRKTVSALELSDISVLSFVLSSSDYYLLTPKLGRKRGVSMETEDLDASQQNRKDYTNCCYLCRTEISLRMYPIRNLQGEMVGWIFICGSHEDHEIPETVSL